MSTCANCLDWFPDDAKMCARCSRLRELEAEVTKLRTALDTAADAANRIAGLDESVGIKDRHIDELRVRICELEAKNAELTALLELSHNIYGAHCRRENELTAEVTKLRAALDAAANAFQDLTWRVVANAGRLSEERKPRWSHVSDATAHGSTASAGLCASAGFDPDEDRGGES